MRIFQIDSRSLSILRRRARIAANGHLEVCGAVISDEDDLLALKFLRNISKEPSKWLIDARRLGLMRKGLKGGGRRLVGTFHSHTRGYACPSQGDMARYPGGFLMLIYDVIGDALGLWRPIRSGRARGLRCLPLAKSRDPADIKNALHEAALLRERNRSHAKRKRPDRSLRRMLARVAEHGGASPCRPEETCLPG